MWRDTTWVRLEEPENGQPEKMTEQAERLLKLEGESRGVDICGPKWPDHGPETQIGKRLNPPIRFCYNAFRVWSG